MVKSLALIAAVSLGATASAQTVMFDFNNANQYSPLPVTLTVGGITANLTGTGQSFSIQSANALGFTPAGFDGLCIYPDSVYPADLIIDFGASRLTDFSIMYAPEEYGCDSSATMRVTTYLNNALVGTNTATAPNPGTWPTGVLSISSVNVFNHVVVHYDAAPVTGGDWGPIFMADNMQVTAVPEPTTLAGLSLAGIALLRRRRH